MEILLFFLCIALIGYLFCREYMAGVERQENAEERQDLLDRLMARNFVEYKERTEDPIDTPVDAPSSIVDLEDAKEEILHGEEE